MLQIRLLGQFDVRADGKRVNIPSRTAQSLFAYLALTAGTVHRREKLAGTFWPDTSDENARKNLRQELWRIRKAISIGATAAADYFVADEITLAFNKDAHYWLDVHQLEKPDSDLQSLTSDLSLYEGELLPGFYDDWVALERERIQTVFETRMEKLIEQLVKAERWTAVQEQGERWLALGGAPEPAYRALMLAYGSRGNTARVASIFQRCTDDLHELFGIEPSAETRALYEGLLKGARAPARPSGTITFLFTDIEGSTRLLDQLGGQYAAVLAEHHEILRLAIQKWKGTEVDTQGDAFFVTFTRASDAVQCAVEAQRALALHHWIEDLPLRVRMGVHTGEPLVASIGYVGMDVHRAARIGDAGHGGQVLLSQSTRELVIHDLPKGVAIRDLGEHRLKDMKYPTPIYQLVIDGLPSEFPALRTKYSGVEPPAPGDPPFKGLQYFDEGDADIFFGREALTAKLVGHLREAPSLCTVVGASGSGKSSLVRAGLIPALKRGAVLMDGTQPPDDSTGWDVHVITPSAHPLEALATELTRGLESVTAAATLIDDLTSDPRSLHLYLFRKTPPRDPSSVVGHTLLLIDQFEELFTLCRDEFEREAFIDNLLTAISPGTSDRQGSSHVTLVITLRADFYPQLARYPDLRNAFAQHQDYIGPMTTDELRRAMEGPAARDRWEFEPGLVDLILRDVGDEPGALPLLSHALLETWKRRAGHTLTLKGYADAGGVRGAIAHTAESLFRNLAPEDQAIARDIFLRLTELGEETEDTRRRASFDELMSSSEDADHVRSVLNRLAEARLITIGEDTAEVAHEALIREWPTLREWLDQDRQGLHLHRHLTEATHEWDLLGRDPGALYRGAHLAQAREWSALHPKDLNAAERAFLDASEEWEQQEQMRREAQWGRELEAARKLAESERQRSDGQARSARQLRRRAYYLGGLLVVALILAIAAFVQRNAANRQEHVARARELAAAAINNLQTDPERSILLALQAYSTADTLEARGALHQAIAADRLRITFQADEKSVYGVTISPDGQRVVTASLDGTVKVWEFSHSSLSNPPVLTLSNSIDFDPVEEGAGEALALSPDGRRLAAISGNQTVKLWDLADGRLLHALTGHSANVYAVAFSPDGKVLASAGDDASIKLWDGVTGQELQTLAENTGSVFCVAFSPDGKYLASAGVDKTVRIWSLQGFPSVSGQQVISLPVDDVAQAVVFSPDGKRLAAGVGIGVEVWDLDLGTANLAPKLSLNIPGHGNAVIGLSFSADGKQLVSGGVEGNARVWDASTGQERFLLAGGTGAISSIALSPDATRLFTASTDGTLKLWDLTPAANQEWFSVSGYSGHISADGRHLLTHVSGLGTSEGEFQLSDLSTTGIRESRRLSFDPGGMVSAVAYRRDLSQLATLGFNAGSPSLLKIWSVETGQLVTSFPLGGHQDVVFALNFSPDGALIATASDDGTARVWEVSTGREVLLLTGHTAPIRSVVFSPDGRWLATGSYDATARLWDARTGQWLRTFSGHDAAVITVAFSADGTRAATASSDKTARVWDVQTGKEILTLRGHSSGVFWVAFSADGRQITTGSVDGTAKIWDVATGQELLTFYGMRSEFTPDGKQLIAYGIDGVTRGFFLDMADLVGLARSRLTRTWTEEECQKYLHQPACP